MTLEEINKLDKRTRAYKEAMAAYEKELGESTTSTESDKKSQSSTNSTKPSGTKMSDKHRTTQYYTQEELNEKYEAAKPMGLGDAVERFTEATGIKKVVKWIAGEDCGCDDRKDRLNKLRFRKTPLCLNEEEFAFLDKLYNKGSLTIGHTEKETLVKIEERIFQKKYADSLNCEPCIRNIYNDLKEIYNVYR